MGRRGPQSKPRAQKVAEGQRLRNDRESSDPPEFRALDREPPGFLSEVGRDEWARVVDELVDQGIATSVDRMALAAYCESCSAYLDALFAYEEVGTTDQGAPFRGQLGVKATGDVVVHAATRNLRDARKALLGAAAHFGLTPATRNRISRGDAPRAEPTNEFANNSLPRHLSGGHSPGRRDPLS
jgi:P27 family predicted phage terminase small subunit